MLARAARSPALLWSAFLAVHLVLVLINLYGYGWPLGDVTSVYLYWSNQAIAADFWVGIDSAWVYPIVAIVPMLVASAGYPLVAAITGTLPDGSVLYAISWLVQMTVLNAVAFGVLTGWGRRTERFAAGWWWTLFLFVLGPIALGRIDSVTVAIAVVGVLLIATRPRTAAILLTVGAWVKVWPGAVVIAMVIATKERWRVLTAAVITSAVIAGIALALGSGANVLSFVTTQTGRGLQIEAPITTVWMWLAAAGADTIVYYDDEMLTWQVDGPGAETASALMTPLLLIVVAVIAVLGILAVRRGATAAAVLPPLVLALLTGMIAFQKVGSPQFIAWLAVPVLLGLVSHREGHSRSFRIPAALALVTAALTHVMYPYLYGYLIGVFPAMLGVLTVRNALVLVLLGWAVAALVRLAVSAPSPTRLAVRAER